MSKITRAKLSYRRAFTFPADAFECPTKFKYTGYVQTRKPRPVENYVHALHVWYDPYMRDVNVRISRTAYNNYSIAAAKRRKKVKGRVSIKQLIEGASKLLKV